MGRYAKAIGLVIYLGVGWGVGRSAAWAVPVAVSNPGFEVPGHGPGGFAFTVPGWQGGDLVGKGMGTFEPTTARFPGGVPEGDNVAFSNGPFISQVLAEPLTAGATYTLQVDVGDRNDAPFPGYAVELRAGGVTLASSAGPTPGDGAFTTATVDFTAPDVHPQADTPLEIRLLSGGIQVNYDDVRLDTTLPSPGVPLAVANSGFEQSGHSDGGLSFGIPGWDALGQQGDFNPLASQGHPTDGELVAFSNAGTISQVLADVLEPFSRYVLTVDLIDRLDTTFPDYQVQLLAGGQLLAQDDNLLSPSDDFLTSKVEFLTQDLNPLLGEPLEIRLISDGIQANFDDVRLTLFENPAPVPEPVSSVLGAMGLVAVGATMRRRRLSLSS